MRRAARADRARYRRGPRPAGPGGRALLLLSRSADNARLWLANAAGLAVSGGRFRRRAALR
ncbi:MAG TPA: hypothetical protein VE760_01400, partial [Acidimicrobiales bacterium]|nr:hypothetical protein [Acidimicrobiales bacterium]